MQLTQSLHLEACMLEVTLNRNTPPMSACKGRKLAIILSIMPTQARPAEAIFFCMHAPPPLHVHLSAR